LLALTLALTRSALEHQERQENLPYISHYIPPIPPLYPPYISPV
jgi:hypothetical protein